MIRHFRRRDGNAVVSRPGARVSYVETGQTFHLDTDKPDEQKIADDLTGNDGWEELDEAGNIIPWPEPEPKPEPEATDEGATPSDDEGQPTGPGSLGDRPPRTATAEPQIETPETPDDEPTA